jgi:hypothetical protein
MIRPSSWLRRRREGGGRAHAAHGGDFSSGSFAVEVLALIAERPHLTLAETATELRERRTKTSRRSRRRFRDLCRSSVP